MFSCEFYEISRSPPVAASARLKLFQKLIEAYTDAYKEKHGKDVQLEVCIEWKEIKKMDLDLEIAVDKGLKMG